MRIGRRILLGGWLGLLVFTTAARGLVWQSEFALWTDAVTKAPWKPRALINYGELVQDHGDLQGALALYQRAYDTLAWRQDRRSAVSKYYAVQDIGGNLIRQQRQTELWALLRGAGCDEVTSADQRRVSWTCHVSRW